MSPLGSYLTVTVVMLSAIPVFGQGRPFVVATSKPLERVEEKAEHDTEKTGGTRWHDSLEVAVGATGVIQGTSGVGGNLSSDGNTTEVSMSFDLEFLVPISKGGNFFALFETGDGGDWMRPFPP